MNNKAEISLTGLVFGLIIVAMVSSVFAIFLSSGEVTYGVEGEGSLAKYNKTSELLDEAEAIRNSTDFTQKTSALDIIGGYFSSGYSALKITAKSFTLFNSMLDDTNTDIPFMSKYNFKGFIFALFLILIFVGVIIAILVKMRI